jgi:hypothetical protein
MKPIQQRLTEKLVETKNGCLEWSGYKDRYGVINIGGKLKKTHRVAWEIKNGQIPKGMMVLHKCDNPPCCNVEHLFIGDQKANMADARSKGRLIAPKCPREKLARGERNWMSKNGHLFRGANNNNSKLTHQDIEDIIISRARGVKIKTLASYFSVSDSTIIRVFARNRNRLPTL